ncbi:sensor histidine kinase [Phenylobacterium sp.]|uniref:sensor histidine kinase n=1 Tax=Phenylobacterium sp. TaxID=1871053 RepID=UPI0025EA1932|nr:sensor histidine kinase [Phenylobacterium sp.]
MNFEPDDIAELRTALTRKERELREAHHRIANSLQLACGFLERQGRGFDDPAVREAFTMAAARLKAVGKVHRHLYTHSADSQVDLKPFLADFCPEIAESTGLECSIDAESVIVPGEVAQDLAIVINELCLNAAKHGYAGKGGGRVCIRCRREEAHLRLVVADGGLGLPDNFSPSRGRGLGLSVIRAITRQLGGRFDASSESGARFTLTIPLAQLSRSLA